MAWQDRPYYRDSSASPRNPLLWLLNGSVALPGAPFGIRIRIHGSMFFFAGLELLLAPTRFGVGPGNTIVWMVILFGSVLLHEFGHCFGSRLVGGDPDEILMWPLGGLATANPPHRPWPSFFTTACGPLVNLLLCALSGGAVMLIHGTGRFLPWIAPLSGPIVDQVPTAAVTYYLWWIFFVNWWLFTFNVVLVFYPFDGGRMIQELLWVWIGYYKSMLYATVVGMAAAVVGAAAGVAFRSLDLLLLAGLGFFACYQQRQMLRETGPEEDWLAGNSTDFSAAYEPLTPSRPRRKKMSRRAMNRARRRAAAAAEEQSRVDAILSKVSSQGMASLTWRERRILKKATEHQRQRDLNLSKSAR